MIRRMREFDWMEFRVRRPVVAALAFGASAALAAYTTAVLISLTWEQEAPFIAAVFVFNTCFQLRANLQLARTIGKT